MTRGRNSKLRTEDVAPKKASSERSPASRPRSSREMSAQGSTARNIHVVFVIVAVLSGPTTGINTTKEANITRRRRDESHCRERWYTLQASRAPTDVAARAAYRPK